MREAGGIIGLVHLLRAGPESPSAIKASETLEVILDACAANERATISAVLEGEEGVKLLAKFPTLQERLQARGHHTPNLQTTAQLHANWRPAGAARGGARSYDGGRTQQRDRLRPGVHRGFRAHRA